jgi:hypothetical protein
MNMQIVDKSFLGKYPYVTVNMGNYKKDIPIEVNMREQIKNSSSVILTINKGLFGFDIISDKQLH